MKFIYFPGQSKNGHTLLASILDAHPNIQIANAYHCQTIEEVKEVASKPNQWEHGKVYQFKLPGQGTVTELKAIGITGGTPIEGDWTYKPILIIRNPFDVIGSSFAKNKRKENPLIYTIEQYEKRIRSALNLDPFLIYHEKWIEYPNINLINIASYINVRPYEEWLNTSASIIKYPPIRSYDKVEWTNEAREKTLKLINTIEELNVYDS